MAEKQLPFGSAGGGSASGPDVGRDVTAEFLSSGSSGPLTVTELLGRVKEALLDAFEPRLAVVGEISNFKRHSSGHLYFSLKDPSASIEAVMFRQAAAGVRFDLADGLEVVAEGRVDVWEKAGRLQFYVQRITPRGAGALELAFRQLKERLEAEGLFDPARKKPLVRFPRAVGVITSPTGAVVRDIARTLARRWPAARVYLVPVRVQGDSAVGEIAEALGLLDAAADRLEIDTIIVGRGGGALEDLWAFNEEAVARAIFAAATPIISAVGHETDVTIADFVADVRAATPTAAAELAVPDGADLRRHCRTLAGRLDRRMRDLLENARGALVGLGRSVVFRDPAWRVRSAGQQLDELITRMAGGLSRIHRTGEQRLAQADRVLAAHHPRRRREQAAAALAKVARDLAWVLGRRTKLAGDALAERSADLAAAHPRHRARLARQRVGALRRQLDAMSYRAVLRRGYSVTRLAGQILRRAADARPGEPLETELADGKVRSTVAGSGAKAAPKPRNKQDTSPTLFDDTEE